MNIKKLTGKLMICGAILALCSCATPKNYVYFQDINEGDILKAAEQHKMLFQPYDELNIVVETKDENLRAAYNKSIVSDLNVNNLTGIDRIMPYTIDENGDVEMPRIGKVHIAGMSRRDAEIYVQNLLRQEAHVKDAIVNIYDRNWRYMVLGEVVSPGIHSIYKDKLTILEAIAASGDLTMYGRRENITLIRQEGDASRVYRIDLTSAKNLYASPVFYIQQDDIIYVSPTELKTRESTINGTQPLSYTFWLSLASVVTTLAVLIFK